MIGRLQNRRWRNWIILAAICVLAFPCSALADTGTPLMFAGLFHLVIGNAIIGVFEGLLIAWVFGVSKRKAILVMIPANYFSAWVGCLLLDWAIVSSLHLNLNNAWRWLWVMVFVTYIITLVLEWPFVAFCFRRTEHWLGRSLKANALANTASYVILFGWYWMASGTSLYTKVHVTSPANLTLPEGVVVYFISPTDGCVYKRALRGAGQTRICDLHSAGAGDRLFARPNLQDDRNWDLMAWLETNKWGRGLSVAVITNLAVEATLDNRASQTSPPESTWANFGDVEPLGSATNSAWEFKAGSSPIEGMQAGNMVSGQRVSFAYETPFGSWTVRNAVQLPSDKVLSQLGDDQICAFDPQSRAVALLWHGRGPVPVIEHKEQQTQAP